MTTKRIRVMLKNPDISTLKPGDQVILVDPPYLTISRRVNTADTEELIDQARKTPNKPVVLDVAWDTQRIQQAFEEAGWPHNTIYIEGDIVLLYPGEYDPIRKS